MRAEQVSGLSDLLDGAGSAYDIGRDALKAALHEEDMQKQPSLLRRMLYKKLNTGTVWEHINTVYNEGKPYIAGIASVVFEAYQQGDETAKEIIDRNAKALAELLNAGVSLYGAKPLAIASGGLFEHHGDIMTEHIGKYSNVILKTSVLPPIYGACRSACLMGGCKPIDGFYENFKKTYGGIKP